MKRYRSDLLNALASPVTTDGKKLSCAVLRTLIQGHSVRVYKLQKRERALLLLALYVQLTLKLLEDGVLSPYEPRRRRWSCDIQARPVLVRASRFTFAAPRFDQTVRLPRRTQNFLHNLPREFAQHMVRWAPPVVSPVDPAGDRVPVLGNGLSAYLAQWVLSDAQIWCRELCVATPPRFSVTDLCCGVHTWLFDIHARYRPAIAQAAPNLDVAQLLTGQSRATVARARRRPWAGP